jgi:ketosteroid isomerase-like protein
MKSMGYKTISVVLLVAVGMIIMAASHKQESQKKQETFDRNVATVKALFQGFVDGDLDAQMELYADDVKGNPAQYNGNVLIDKQGVRETLKFFHDNFKDIVFHEGVGLTTGKSNGFFGGSAYPLNNNPNIVATYGTWTPTHIETGKKIFNKYHSVGEFNDAGKIVYFSEFWDVSGIQVQLESTAQSAESE